MNTANRQLLLWLTLFGLAFGYIEAAVVVYLREVLYPAGFTIDMLMPRPPRVLWTEVGREFATLLLLLAVARLAVRGGLRRFGVFAFCFGLWDLVYYLTLKVILDWPASLLDWDILFLIPAPWTAPVLAPVLVSLALVFAGAILLLSTDEQLLSLDLRDWLIEIGAGVVIVATFFWGVPAMAAGQAPNYFPWWLFAIGYLGGLGWFKYRWWTAWRKV